MVAAQCILCMISHAFCCLKEKNSHSVYMEVHEWGVTWKGHSWLIFYQHAYNGGCHVMFMHFAGQGALFCNYVSVYNENLCFRGKRIIIIMSPQILKEKEHSEVRTTRRRPENLG